MINNINKKQYYKEILNKYTKHTFYKYNSIQRNEINVLVDKTFKDINNIIYRTKINQTLNKNLWCFNKLEFYIEWSLQKHNTMDNFSLWV